MCIAQASKTILRKINLLLKTIGTNLLYHYKSIGSTNLKSLLQIIENKAFILG